MRIAYVVPTYPLFLQTYVVNEMIEVQEAGHEVVVVPLYATPSPPVCHESFERLRPVAVLSAALFDLKVACLALWMLFTHPLRVLGTLLPLHWAAGFNVYTHASLIAIAPKALATAWRLRPAQVGPTPAHFPSHPTLHPRTPGRVSGNPF